MPDVVAEGSSDQKVIMSIICGGKGATFDGTDCVGELNDSPIRVSTTHTFLRCVFIFRPFGMLFNHFGMV